MITLNRASLLVTAFFAPALAQLSKMSIFSSFEVASFLFTYPHFIKHASSPEVSAARNRALELNSPTYLAPLLHGQALTIAPVSPSIITKAVGLNSYRCLSPLIAAVGAVPADALLAAASEGHFGAVQALAPHCEDPSAVGADGVSVLTLCAAAGNHRSLRTLLSAGADPSSITPSGRTALIAAIDADDESDADECVRLLLGAGVDPNGACSWRPLVRAAANGRARLVRTLLSAGANSNDTAVDGFTPLMGACRAGSAEVTLLLLAAGAEAGAVTASGNTALHEAAGRGGKLLTTMITAVKNVNLADTHGFTPLHAAAANPDPVGLHRLVEAGANVNATTKDSYLPEGWRDHPKNITPLMLAAHWALVDNVRVLLAAGAVERLDEAAAEAEAAGAAELAKLIRTHQTV